MTFTKREIAAVLAGLRLLQNSSDLPEAIADVNTNGGTQHPLSDSEIDELCERLNTGPCCYTPPGVLARIFPHFRARNPFRNAILAGFAAAAMIGPAAADTTTCTTSRIGGAWVTECRSTSSAPSREEVEYELPKRHPAPARAAYPMEPATGSVTILRGGER